MTFYFVMDDAVFSAFFFFSHGLENLENHTKLQFLSKLRENGGCLEKI